jgi:hypothetical protein
MDEHQFVNVTAYYAEPVKIFSVPAHYSLDEIREAIQSEMSAATFEAPSRNLSSIIITSSEFSFSIIYSQTIKCPKAWAKETLPLGKLRRKGQSM